MAIVPYDDWSESFKTGAISAAGNYLGGLLGKGISQGLGTENAYWLCVVAYCSKLP